MRFARLLQTLILVGILYGACGRETPPVLDDFEDHTLSVFDPTFLGLPNTRTTQQENGTIVFGERRLSITRDEPPFGFLNLNARAFISTSPITNMSALMFNNPANVISHARLEYGDSSSDQTIDLTTGGCDSFLIRALSLDLTGVDIYINITSNLNITGNPIQVSVTTLSSSVDVITGQRDIIAPYLAGNIMEYAMATSLMFKFQTMRPATDAQFGYLCCTSQLSAKMSVSLDTDEGLPGPSSGDVFLFKIMLFNMNTTLIEPSQSTVNNVVVFIPEPPGITFVETNVTTTTGSVQMNLMYGNSEVLVGNMTFGEMACIEYRIRVEGQGCFNFSGAYYNASPFVLSRNTTFIHYTNADTYRTDFERCCSPIPNQLCLEGPPTTSPPTTQSPTTRAPTTLPPTTLVPTTLVPTTLSPTTLQPTTSSPTTSPPTNPPTTSPPTTLQPTTLPPTTSPPTTSPPTNPPTTLAPTTLSPTTLPPTTLPTTIAPTTIPPTTTPPTESPTTLQPTTSSPTTLSPTVSPTNSPTTNPPTTSPPIEVPTTIPPTTNPPTVAPTSMPTTNPPTTMAPITSPTQAPTTLQPTTLSPTTDPPTNPPTIQPSVSPTVTPTTSPPTTSAPTTSPPTTLSPTPPGTIAPTISPTTASPTTSSPTIAPVTTPPTAPPTVAPTNPPTTLSPTTSPPVTLQPTVVPTRAPTRQPTLPPTLQPTVAPTRAPTRQPTLSPTFQPSIAPTRPPTRMPTTAPTMFVPTLFPTTRAPTTTNHFCVFATIDDNGNCLCNSWPCDCPTNSTCFCPTDEWYCWPVWIDPDSPTEYMVKYKGRECFCPIII